MQTITLSDCVLAGLTSPKKPLEGLEDQQQEDRGRDEEAVTSGGEGQGRVADKVLVEVVALGRHQDGHDVRRRLADGRQEQEPAVKQRCQGELEQESELRGH